jgi:hypothetical protein
LSAEGRALSGLGRRRGRWRFRKCGKILGGRGVFWGVGGGDWVGVRSATVVEVLLVGREEIKIFYRRLLLLIRAVLIVQATVLAGISTAVFGAQWLIIETDVRRNKLSLLSEIPIPC